MLPVEPVSMACPYCGEPVELLVEPSDQPQAYVEDCTVCCRPWQVRVYTDTAGRLVVEARRDDET